MAKDSKSTYTQHLIQWFGHHRRSFPWRDDPNPYQVWISEVMLQQTQASVVVPYFERWMTHFPTIDVLAAADLDQVLKIWEGLGYYSRARRLHAAAIYLVEKHHGEIPQDREALMKIPGIGPYTVGAILSFAFHHKAPAVDGNVSRVMARFCKIEGAIEKQTVQKEIYGKVMELLPNEKPWVAMEALIELGAVVCSRRPSCSRCPLQEGCRAFKDNAIDNYPQKLPRKKTVHLLRAVALIRHHDDLLVERSTENRLMSHLCQFPFIELSPSQEGAIEMIVSQLEEKTGCRLRLISALDETSHAFTYHQARLIPFLFDAIDVKAHPPYQWIKKESLQLLPFAAGHRTLLKKSVYGESDEKDSTHRSLDGLGRSRKTYSQ